MRLPGAILSITANGRGRCYGHEAFCQAEPVAKATRMPGLPGAPEPELSSRAPAPFPASRMGRFPDSSDGSETFPLRPGFDAKLRSWRRPSTVELALVRGKSANWEVKGFPVKPWPVSSESGARPGPSFGCCASTTAARGSSRARQAHLGGTPGTGPRRPRGCARRISGKSATDHCATGRRHAIKGPLHYLGCSSNAENNQKSNYYCTHAASGKWGLGRAPLAGPLVLLPYGVAVALPGGEDGHGRALRRVDIPRPSIDVQVHIANTQIG